MGLVGLRFAHMKRKLGVRTAIAAVLEEGPVICSVVVATELDDHDRDYALQRLAAVRRPCGRPALRGSAKVIQHPAKGWMLPVIDLDPVNLGQRGSAEALMRHRINDRSILQPKTPPPASPQRWR